jgi:hypothetical protein
MAAASRIALVRFLDAEGAECTEAAEDQTAVIPSVASGYPRSGCCFATGEMSGSTRGLRVRHQISLISGER